MKKARLVLILFLFLLTVFLPFGTLISSCFGYRFKLTSTAAFTVAIVLLSICVVILDILCKDKIDSKAIDFLLAVITPLSLVNAVFYILACRETWVIVSVFISSGCCWYLAIKYGKPVPLKAVALVLSGLMVMPIFLFSLAFLLFGEFGQTTVVKTVESPSGKYYAQVIDSDQGALGGDTLVDVYEKKTLNAFLFKIEKKPQNVYFGEWGEFKNMQIYWKDDGCLVINSIEYKIN